MLFEESGLVGGETVNLPEFSAHNSFCIPLWADWPITPLAARLGLDRSLHGLGETAAERAPTVLAVCKNFYSTLPLHL